MSSRVIRRPSSTTTQELLSLLDDLNKDPAVNGILVQLPLPGDVDAQAVLDAVSPLKDVDAFSPENVGLLVQGRPRFLPCTPHGVIHLLARYDIELQGKHVVVVGRSEIVGKPLANMLLQRDIGYGPKFANATVTVCHSKSGQLGSITKTADVLIAAVGRAHLITADMVKMSAVVVDVGINRLNEKLVGDVDYNSVRRSGQCYYARTRWGGTADNRHAAAEYTHRLQFAESTERRRSLTRLFWLRLSHFPHVVQAAGKLMTARRLTLLCLLWQLTAVGQLGVAEEWWQFRGPNSGHVSGQGFPGNGGVFLMNPSGRHRYQVRAGPRPSWWTSGFGSLRRSKLP